MNGDWGLGIGDWGLGIGPSKTTIRKCISAGRNIVTKVFTKSRVIPPPLSDGRSLPSLSDVRSHRPRS